MKSLVKLLLSAIAVVLLAKILPGIAVDGFWTAIVVAVVLALLRMTVRPILVFLTFPITIVTFGLFLLIINAVIILLTDYIITGFEVASLWWVLLFSLLLSIFESILFSVIKED